MPEPKKKTTYHKPNTIFNFEDLFDLAKQRVKDNKLTLRELEENTAVSEELLAILFDNSNNIIKDISRLLKWLNYRYNYSELIFRVYELQGTDKQIKIIRKIKPLCSVFYDIERDKYYKFRTYPAKAPLTEIRKNTILGEMREHLEYYLENK